MKLRPYQERVINEVRDHMRAGKRRILIVVPTGGGKTVLAAFMAKGTLDRGLSTWFMCHRDFLLHQTHGTFEQAGLRPDMIASGVSMRPGGLLQVCGVMTLVNRLAQLAIPKVRFWDEAHHTAAGSWKKIIEWCGGQGYDIGLTATPQRLDGKGLSDCFDVIVMGPTVAELIELGSLARYKAYAPGVPDLSAVRKAHGDYNLADVGLIMDTNQIVGDLVHHYQRLSDNRRGIYFAVNVEHSQHIAAAFNAAGIPAMHLDAGTSKGDRKAIARRFADGELQILTNVDLFGEGYDLAAQAGRDVTVDLVGMARPTQSLTLYLQQAGRMLRPKSDGRPGILLDHAGNILKHGLPDEEREWTLEGRPKKAQERSIQICDNCGGANPPEAKTCVCCGEPLKEITEGRQRKGPDTTEGELEEIDKAKLAAIREQEERACTSYEDFKALGKRRGYHPRWATIQWQFAERRMARTRGATRRYGY